MKIEREKVKGKREKVKERKEKVKGKGERCKYIGLTQILCFGLKLLQLPFFNPSLKAGVNKISPRHGL